MGPHSLKGCTRWPSPSPTHYDVTRRFLLLTDKEMGREERVEGEDMSGPSRQQIINFHGECDCGTSVTRRGNTLTGGGERGRK